MRPRKSSARVADEAVVPGDCHGLCPFSGPPARARCHGDTRWPIRAGGLKPVVGRAVLGLARRRGAESRQDRQVATGVPATAPGPRVAPRGPRAGRCAQVDFRDETRWRTQARHSKARTAKRRAHHALRRRTGRCPQGTNRRSRTNCQHAATTRARSRRSGTSSAARRRRVHWQDAHAIDRAGGTLRAQHHRRAPGPRATAAAAPLSAPPCDRGRAGRPRRCGAGDVRFVDASSRGRGRAPAARYRRKPRSSGRQGASGGQACRRLFSAGNTGAALLAAMPRSACCRRRRPALATTIPTRTAARSC